MAGYVVPVAMGAKTPVPGGLSTGAKAGTGSGFVLVSSWGAPSVSGLANVDIRAQVRARSQATIAAEMGGVLSLMLPEGRRFDKGDVLARLDCSLFTAQRDKSLVEVSAAQLQFNAQERLAQLEAGSQTDLALARNAVERLQAELKIMETQVTKCTVTAPFNGVVGEHLQQNHQFVQPGQALMVVLDDGGFEIEFLAPSTWLRRIAPGDAVFILVDELGLNMKAQVLRTGTRVDPVSQSVKVVAQVINPPPQLKAGMSGRVAIARPTRP
jgi:RND family efflux transporter MFP subunit